MSQFWFTYLLCCCSINGHLLPWSWDKVALWADFFTRNVSLLTDYESEFVATHYNVISLEKCLGQPTVTNISTEQSFYKIASNIRRYASTNETKIVFYFNIPQCFYKCYDITNSFYANESMWFKDDYGNIIFEKSGNPYYDHTQHYVRDWWVNAVVSVMKTALNQNIIVNGLFGDGVHHDFNTANVSKSRNDQYNNGIILLLDGVKQAFSEINNDLFVIGNGISTYTSSKDHNLEIMSHVDGMLEEHFGAFEEIIHNQNAKINATDLLFLYNVSRSIQKGVYGQNKTLLIKSWIGPESQPINSFGPTWPSTYGTATPTTHQAVQNASLSLISFPLAVYLCGIYNKNVYFSYAWWYGIDQGYVPCTDDPSTCDCPVNWYKEFTNKLGQPKTNGLMRDTYKCNRSFEYANVYVDLNDETSAIIDWL